MPPGDPEAPSPNPVQALLDAAARSPLDAAAHFNLANAFQNLERFDEAVRSFHRALELRPDLAEAHNNLGNIFTRLRRPEEAEASFRRALEIRPAYPNALNNLGLLLQGLGRLEEAAARFGRAVAVGPDFAAAHFNLGNALQGLKRFDEAEASYRRAIGIRPDFAGAHVNLGNLQAGQGRFDEAEASYRSAIEAQPRLAEAHNNLGGLLSKRGEPGRAEESYRRALAIRPGYPDALNQLGDLLHSQGRLGEAEASFRRSIELVPQSPGAYVGLAGVLNGLGRLEAAEQCYRKAIELRPDFIAAHSSLLFLRQYMPQYGPQARFEDARRFGDMVRRQVRGRFSSWTCADEPERLRVGLVSGDLHDHPVGYFLEGVLGELDTGRIELFAYPTVNVVTALTRRIRPYFSAWRPLSGLDDEQAAGLVRSDAIHVLIDLSGHTASNRLALFAWKPAPVQATWIGYFATTGVEEIDFFLTDSHLLPPEDEDQFTEKPWRLPGMGCLTPPPHRGEPNAPPCLSAGVFTFGCFNNLRKVTDEVVALWAKILRAAPASRLFLKAPQLGEPSVAEETLRRFGDHGIPADRLVLEGPSPREQYLEAYRRVDVALDPFPYPGGTTTIEGLWMGVPAITLRGDRMLSRMGESVAHRAGLPEWIAAEEGDYLAKAVGLVADPAPLVALRSGLRERVRSSQLYDSAGYARVLEQALWGMWRAARPPG
ncbi:MAG TPA: tetratricopeptide repeat protein [Caulobacteraceae bacterium]|nr:tetratricopeptide repeat protein [Caulobacteraceae bacterium]